MEVAELGIGNATVLWLIASFGFSWYVSAFNSYDKVYGSIGAVVILSVLVLAGRLQRASPARELDNAIERSAGIPPAGPEKIGHAWPLPQILRTVSNKTEASKCIRPVTPAGRVGMDGFQRNISLASRAPKQAARSEHKAVRNRGCYASPQLRDSGCCWH